MKTNVLLFGMLADEIKQSTIEIENAFDTDSLLSKLKAFHPVFKDATFAIAVNMELVNGNASIFENDEIALLPPFAGG